MLGLSTAKLVIIAGLVMAIIAAGTGIYLKGAQNARQKAEIALLRANLKVTQEHLSKTKRAYEADTALAAEDQITLNALRNRVQELNSYVAQIDDTACLSGDDVDQLRRLWSHGSP